MRETARGINLWLPSYLTLNDCRLGRRKRHTAVQASKDIWVKASNHLRRLGPAFSKISKSGLVLRLFFKSLCHINLVSRHFLHMGKSPDTCSQPRSCALKPPVSGFLEVSLQKGRSHNLWESTDQGNCRSCVRKGRVMPDILSRVELNVSSRFPYSSRSGCH